MAFSIRLCPYCGGAINSDEAGYYVCEECEKRTYRSRTNSMAYLLNKPYEEDYKKILDTADISAEKALDMIEEIITEAEEPDADMFFTRGFVFAKLGEDGKAHIDWKKGLELLQDVRFIDAYIIPVCKSIMEIMYLKETEFIEFNPREYIDSISTEFSLKCEAPTRGIFYITTYRVFRIAIQGGTLENDDDVYSTIISKLIGRILVYGRNFRTVCDIIEEALEDFHYNPDTYIEDDNLKLHLSDLLRQKYLTLSKDFSDEHITRIFRHWNDENMYELEYWMTELIDSLEDVSLLQKLHDLVSSEKEGYDLDQAVEDYARKFLLLDKDGNDLSKEA
ncbi:MAG: hypothetical protein E7Z70_01605 [Thermoplasmata archaeon]|nr:hypothetical protein [Thermoplasmata archaeon]